MLSARATQSGGDPRQAGGWGWNTPRRSLNTSAPSHAPEGALRFAAMRRFVGIDLGREPVPDETTVCRFRHLLEERDLGRPLFDEMQRHLDHRGDFRRRPSEARRLPIKVADIAVMRLQLSIIAVICFI
jgi:hypothetical protein